MSIGYRFARRSFLGAVGGAVGLKILLRNLEATAAGTPPPPRLMVMYWPVGTVRYHFLPTTAGDISTSRILKPIADAGLASDTIVLYGLTFGTISARFGGGPEGGTVRVMTGASSPGTRANGGEGDDSVAGGPSFDQIFLKNVPALQRPGAGYCNVICDARVDSLETSTQNLSYSHETRQVASAYPANVGPLITENVPLPPDLQPLLTYQRLFGGFSGTPLDPQRVKNLLRARKSVLDHSLRELGRLRALAPASESVRIDQHAEIIRKVETELSNQIDGGAGVCTVPPPPDASLLALSGSHYELMSSPQPVATADFVAHAQVGQAFASILRAAFQCDVIRVATFQWASGSSHVAFAGMYPPDPAGAYMHNPMGRLILSSSEVLTAPPTNPVRANIVEFLANVHTWYNQQTAGLLNGFKEVQDVYGANLLDRTVVPFVTDLANSTSVTNPMPALIFGGRALGMQGGQFLDLTPNRSTNDMWMTIAQAYLNTTDPLSRFTDEVFVKTNVRPIAGLWQPPP